MTFKVVVIVRLKGNRYLKYNVTNLFSFTGFLDRSYPKWLWFNVYNKDTGKQITSFTKYNRPSTKTIPI